MNLPDGRSLALLLFLGNALLLAICVGWIRWSRSWQTPWARALAMICLGLASLMFALGSLVFGACTLYWKGAFS